MFVTFSFFCSAKRLPVFTLPNLSLSLSAYHYYSFSFSLSGPCLMSYFIVHFSFHSYIHFYFFLSLLCFRRFSHLSCLYFSDPPLSVSMISLVSSSSLSLSLQSSLSVVLALPWSVSLLALFLLLTFWLYQVL